jgi:hypothetical protein
MQNAHLAPSPSHLPERLSMGFVSADDKEKYYKQHHEKEERK